MIRYDDFEKVDMRIGTILKAELNPRARKPAYSLTIDFGPLGRKTSSAQITDLYTPEDLTGRQVVAVINFPPKVIAGISSEVLILGIDGEGGVALLGPERQVQNGKRVY
jgi:tRNA-binding protein